MDVFSSFSQSCWMNVDCGKAKDRCKPTDNYEEKKNYFHNEWEMRMTGWRSSSRAATSQEERRKNTIVHCLHISGRKWRNNKMEILPNAICFCFFRKTQVNLHKINFYFWCHYEWEKVEVDTDPASLDQTSQTRMWNKLERNVRGCILSDGRTNDSSRLH